LHAGLLPYGDMHIVLNVDGTSFKRVIVLFDYVLKNIDDAFCM